MPPILGCNEKKISPQKNPKERLAHGGKCKSPKMDEKTSPSE
jgi:hypothetical protein